MDSLILEGVVRTLDRALSGRSLLRWDRLGEADYLLRFATAAGDNLRISLHTPFPALYRLPHRDTPETAPPDPFSGIAARELEGAALISVRRRGADRVVEMDWESASGDRRRLVAELLGKSANLLLLDSESRVIAYARRMASAFRRPEEGKPYQPPLPRPGLEGASLDPRRVESMLQRYDRSLPVEQAATGILQFLSPPLAEDFPHRPGALSDPAAELRRLLEVTDAGRLEPVIYAALPADELLSGAATHRAPVVLSPLPLEHPPAPPQARFGGCEEAVRVFSQIVQAQQAARERREKLGGVLNREKTRLARLAAKLDQERAETQRSEEHQRFGDLILACPSARVAGAVIEVPDLYGEAGRVVRIPADPALTPRENAERHYARARKLRRGAEKIRERLQAVASQASRLSAWEQRLSEARSLVDLEAVEKVLIGERLLSPAPRKPGVKEPPAPENDPGIRKYRTEDGFVILVGKTSRDNDHLTFRVAAPHDFWFHAAGHSGAHVVVRNPARLKELPKSVALSAARIAAHYSRAKGKGKVEVHFTLRKHVRKGKGYAPGLVSLRNHRTLEVEPGIPGGGQGE
ncbi:MAG TPA: NFACT family protein [Candidatus Polarisedimenticolia bacterium]|nr:NFACT family protein [Candidatus Polarisedimenticolia bacterium]